MIHHIFAKKLNDMKHPKQNKSDTASNPFTKQGKEQHQENKHEFKTPKLTKPRELSIPIAADIVLQTDGGIKINLGKKVFVDKIGEKDEGKKENCSEKKKL